MEFGIYLTFVCLLAISRDVDGFISIPLPEAGRIPKMVGATVEGILNQKEALIDKLFGKPLIYRPTSAQPQGNDPIALINKLYDLMGGQNNQPQIGFPQGLYPNLQQQNPYAQQFYPPLYPYQLQNLQQFQFPQQLLYPQQPQFPQQPLLPQQPLYPQQPQYPQQPHFPQEHPQNEFAQKPIQAQQAPVQQPSLQQQPQSQPGNGEQPQSGGQQQSISPISPISSPQGSESPTNASVSNQRSNNES